MHRSLGIPDLKMWLHRTVSRTDKLLVVLASMDRPCQIQDVRQRAKEAGLRIPPQWNPSAQLAATKGKAIRTDQGWELTDSGRQHLSDLGISAGDPATRQIADTLRRELPNIQNEDTRGYVEEAVECYECGLYRSAIVMSWVGAVAILREVVHAGYLPQFNADIKRVDSKWKDVVTSDDFGRLREFDFLDCIGRIGVLGRDVKNQLKECLTRRNSCGHPNSLKISANAVAAHIEILILNVFQRFV